MTLRHDSELMTEEDALETAARWQDLYFEYQTVEKITPKEGWPPELCFYVTNRYAPGCNNKDPNYRPDL
jgi:hypothetical protein